MRVLVAGDLVIDHYVYEGQARLPGTTILDGARWISEPGGVGMVGRLLTTLAGAEPRGGEDPSFVVDAGFSSPSAMASVRAGFSVMQPCERHRGDSARVWRVTRSLGFSRGSLSVAGDSVNTEALDQPADLIVLDDAGLGFRRWPNRHAWPMCLRVSAAALPRWVVLKMSGPIAAGDLWHTIVSGRTQHASQSGSSPVDLGAVAERTVLVVAINELRREFVRVDGRLSWERAAADLIEDLERSVRLRALKALRFVVVRLGLDGALVVDRSDGQARYTLVFDPAGIEGDFLSGVPQGSVFGYQSCLTAAITCALADPPQDGPSSSPLAQIVSGVKSGLAATRRLVVDGHEPVADGATSFPHRRIASEIRRPSSEWRFGTFSLPSGIRRTTSWTIIAGAPAERPAPLWGLARRVAIHGIGQLGGVPYAQFAKLYSVDRAEIESLRMLQRLLTNYMHDAKASKPLSIAAFGPPGSGKSFGIKQLADALFGDKGPLEFNLSQFSTAAELHALLHQVRDKVLQGKVPLVFWDEFDSRDLYWLQYLLAPMQDGTFQDGQITHPIGKCVFVFAGGTRSRFEEFGRPPAAMTASGNPDALEQWHEAFKMKKGSDFKSRLAGYINVLGPNRRDAEDITHPLRRALLLRVHLGLGARQPADIDAGLLEAFLRVGEYRHGARSVEKIAEQVRLSSRTGAFTRSDLPARHQLDLHVDAEEFLNLVESA